MKLSKFKTMLTQEESQKELKDLIDQWSKEIKSETKSKATMFGNLETIDIYKEALLKEIKNLNLTIGTRNEE